MNIELWPSSDFPGTCDADSDKPVEALTPHMKWYPVDESTRPVVLVIPGGGYSHRADEKGERIAAWLNEQGLHAAVLRYRISPWRYPAPQFDALRAVRLLRHQAESLHINPEQIVVLGGSAGGHLAASVALLHDALPLTVQDEVDEVDPRPDLLALIYPVISATDHCHQGSWMHLLGEQASWQQRAAISLNHWVDPECPPTLLFHCVDDRAVPVQNSYQFASALADAGVEHTMHIVPDGGHGWKFENPSTEQHYSMFQARFLEWLHSYLSW